MGIANDARGWRAQSTLDPSVATNLGPLTVDRFGGGLEKHRESVAERGISLYWMRLLSGWRTVFRKEP